MNKCVVVVLVVALSLTVVKSVADLTRPKTPINIIHALNVYVCTLI